ncbi:protein phosphatase 1 regulatory subunit 12A-like isoform X4 [Littorina saxatilis]|uniref:protein phosphatase 1 regulatory subunit 12A-like isoform X4 n=1 Tax=Littorina saxatilis TaxID=31220 RepID=UPI0038B54576
MADEGKQVSALLRRHHQLKRWEDSETNREPGSPRPSAKKVKFQDGCVFLAACSSGDKDEVKKLLERGADINTANVDGLTALHQACIDDNLDMVEFLVEEGADVDVCDNEGWTPLHATASCGFTEIARYLLKHGANVAAVNNDGDLALDIAEDEEMENLLQKEMDTKGVDADSARREEEDCMMADANRWLQDNNIEDNIHPKTGATALHVAAAKGYINVMNVLLQAGADINARDNDGWTPLHAAVHWGQEESCQLLVEHMCDMDIKNNASHTVFDLASADKDMLKILDELKKKQASRRTTSESSPDIIHTAGHGSKRSSVTRMSSDQKQNVITQSSEEERATLDANLSHLSTPKDEEDKPTVTTPSTQDAETERKNELNKQSSLISQPQSPRNRPPSHNASLEPHFEPEMPKIDEVSEPEKPTGTASITTTTTTPTTTIITPPTSTPSSVSETRTSSSSEVAPTATDGTETVDSPQEDLGSKNPPSATSTDELTVPSWRRGLRKNPSTSMVHEKMKENEDELLPRSASSPRLALDHRNETLQDRLRLSTISTGTTTSVTTSVSDTSTDSKPADRYSWSSGQSSYTPYRDYLSRSGYKPYYLRQHELNQQKEQEQDGRGNSRINRPSSSISAFSSSSAPLTNTSTGTTTVVTTSNSTNSVFRRSFEPPKRDEETETQRKARAKHARQTRRSTQGVSLEDIEKAEEVLRQGDSSKKNPATTEDTTSSTRSSLRDSQRDTTTATTTTATTTTTTSSIGSSLQNDRESRTSNLSSRDSFRDRDRDRDETSSYRRRNFEDRLEGDSSTRTSFRRPREDRDSATNNGTSDITSSYVPRSQRNALSTSDINSSSLSSSGVTRSASLRSSRFRNGETETAAEDDKKKDETKKTDSSGTEKEEKKETAAIKARRKRHERRSTGINYSPQEEEKGKENKPEDDEKDETADSSSSRLGRYSSSDVPSDSSGRNRPVSYSEYGQSRSTTNLEDYKKLWEESKEENAKLKKELEQTKKELLEAKEELDRLMKQRESRIDTTDKREKRALERKVSEYEEELKKMEALKVDNQRLKDENGALIRVISKLSK